MEIIRIAIWEVKSNPNNPRVIKDDKFKKLVKSILEFSKMLEIRPIVVNEDMVVLGGNMRLRACQEAGLQEVFIMKANTLTKEEQEEFIIKDNVSFGEWDWDELANKFDDTKLGDWGVGLEKFNFTPNLLPESNANSVTDEEIMIKAKELAHKMVTAQSLISATCPHCLKDFNIQT